MRKFWTQVSPGFRQDKTYYTGVSSDIYRRIEDHQASRDKTCYTYKRRLVELVFYCTFTNVGFAIEFDKRIKKWSRAKKETLINNEFEKLPTWAKKRFEN